MSPLLVNTTGGSRPPHAVPPPPADAILFDNRAIVREWSEAKRYHAIDEAEARLLYAAVENATHGVLPWLKTYW